MQTHEKTIIVTTAALLCAALLCTAVFAQTNNAEYIADTIPTVMIPGFSYDVSVTMKNIGTTTWTRATDYKLGAVGDSDPFAPGRIELADEDSIAQSQQKTFYFTMTAGTAGVHTTDWRMLREHVQWFGDTLTKQVDVTFGPDPPGAPTITWPTAGMILGSNRPDIMFEGDPFDAYEVHIGSYNTPESSDGWDSGEVWPSSAATSASVMSGPLSTQATYYVFVRLHNSNGWGAWTGYGNWFHTAGELLNDPYFVAGPSGSQWQHSMCYNPDRNEYLICYFDNSKGKPSVISYYRLDGTGTKIGSEVWIVDDLIGAGGPHVCYNSVRHEYLIAYGGYTESGGLHDELRLQRVDAVTGALIGGSNWVTNLPGAFGSNVAYSPTSDSYLLLWDSGYDSPCPLYATRLDSTAVPVGGIFYVSTTTYVWAGNPAIAYNSANDEFFVTFQAYFDTEPLTWWDYYGQRVRSSDGALLGSNITISATPEYDDDGDVAYDSDLNRYLVIYAGGNPTPWGQFISASGTLLGARFPMASEYFNGGMSGIAWSPVTKEYLATWAHCCTASNFARRLSQSGAYIGEPFRTNGNVEGFGNWNPTPVANTANGEFLIVWFWQYDNVYVRRYKSLPVPPADTTPPGSVTDLTATPGSAQIVLTWTTPSDSDFSGTTIRYRTDIYPTSVTDGTLVCEQGAFPGVADSYVHTELVGGTTYYYAAFAHDAVPNYAAGVTAQATPTGPITLGPVTNFTATGDDMQVNLSWHTPSDVSFAGTMIRYKTTEYPTGTADGTLLVNKAGTPDSDDSHAHTCLSNNGTTYYYSAFAYDSVPDYSAKSDAVAAPVGAFCFSDRFSYPDGNLNGNGCWAGSAGSEIQVAEQTVKISGGSPTTDAIRTVSCSGSGGIIEVRVQIKGGSGGDTLWGLWIDDPNSNNLARWYGTGTTARPRIGGTGLVLAPATLTGGWDCLDVRIDTTTNIDEFFFNGVSLGTLDHTSTGAGDSVGRVRFERIYNSSPSDAVYLDNLSVGGPDVTPPDPVTDFKAASGDGAVSLSWTNPADSDLVGTKILYKTSGYPTSPTDGTLVCNRTADPNSSDSFTHIGLANGTRCYYAAFAYDGFPNYSSGANVSTTPAAEATIAQAKALDDGEKRLLKGKVVSAIFSGFFYIQEPDRVQGLKVISADTVSIGNVVDVVGTMGSSGGERYIDTGGDQVIVH